MKPHRFNVTLPECAGMGARILLDGRELRSVRQISISAGMNEPTIVTLTMIAEVDGEIEAALPEEA